MPKGPHNEDRPADVIGCAVNVARLSVGLDDEELRAPPGKVRSGQAVGRARAVKMNSEDRSAVAKKAAGARWGL